MRVFIIPGAVLLVAAVAVGCDQGTPTSPSADALVPQFNVIADCPPGFSERAVVEAVDLDVFVDRNEDDVICSRQAGSVGETIMDNNTRGSEGRGTPAR